MTPTEQTTLEAFLLALLQLDVPLSLDLQDKVRQIGRDLKAAPTAAIAEILKLVQQHSQLAELYQTARLTLQEQYQTQERDKLLWDGSGSATLSFADFAGQMLTAEDFPAAMKQWVGRVSKRENPAIDAWKMAVARIELQAFSVLEALEFHPLTMENLAARKRVFDCSTPLE
jgi:hypothetical protein